MESITIFIFFSSFLLLANYEVVLADFKPPKLLVFGDSYADTGNSDKDAGCWKIPYGMTSEKKEPSGRFSDGRVLTDYIALYMNISSPPIAYKKMKPGAEAEEAKYGINFAVGGTGIFVSRFGGPNMTTQIDLFQKIINKYTPTDIQSSVALLSVNGNDYADLNCSSKCVYNWTTIIVDQIVRDLKRLHDLGVKKIGVTELPPLGCVPERSALLSYKECNQTDNEVVHGHNLLLHQAVSKLNNETNDATFVVINLYSAFMTVFSQGHAKFESPYKPCCLGTYPKTSCGMIGKAGEKLYTVCQNPNLTIFWDDYHPTQQTWETIYPILQSDLKKLSIIKLH